MTSFVFDIPDDVIAAGLCNEDVPHRWRDFVITKQRDDDYACGLHCVLAAARHHRTHARTLSPPALVRLVGSPARERIEGRLGEVGLLEQDIRALCDAAQLSVWRPRGQPREQFEEAGWIWMAFVRALFVGPDEARVDRHYVLVLEHLAAANAFVIADPHPWNPSVYCVGSGRFFAAWDSAKRRGPRWAAILHPARPTR